jgi:hypothetical protein
MHKRIMSFRIACRCENLVGLNAWHAARLYGDFRLVVD